MSPVWHAGFYFKRNCRSSNWAPRSQGAQPVAVKMMKTASQLQFLFMIIVAMSTRPDLVFSTTCMVRDCGCKEAFALKLLDAFSVRHD